MKRGEVNRKTKAAKKNRGRGSGVVQTSRNRFVAGHFPVGAYALPVL